MHRTTRREYCILSLDCMFNYCHYVILWLNPTIHPLWWVSSCHMRWGWDRIKITEKDLWIWEDFIIEWPGCALICRRTDVQVFVHTVAFIQSQELTFLMSWSQSEKCLGFNNMWVIELIMEKNTAGWEQPGSKTRTRTIRTSWLINYTPSLLGILFIFFRRCNIRH